MTTTPGLAIGALTADCAPVLFADPTAKVIAAAHAGWKGALAGIVESTVTAMEAVGARRDRIRAAIGPTIGAAAYEVGDEFLAAFLARDKANAIFFARRGPDNRHYFDLPGFIASRLVAADIAAIEDLRCCTYTQEGDFHSFRRMTHRREADYGRQISAIVLE